MSRCFPFPPPGYEKKARTEGEDLLKKEKHKEKKHKKEKKDKEKSSKEKKEKDRSDEKHREKKDKKEKKEKKKEKDRDKDKNSNSDEKRLAGKSEGPSGEKTSNERKFSGKSEGHNGEKFIQKEKEREKDRSSISGEKKFAGQFSVYNGEKLSQNSYPGGAAKDAKFVQELVRRVRDEDRGIGTQLAEKFAGTDQKRDEGMVRLVAKATSSLDEGKEKKDKRGDDKKFDAHVIRDEARLSGNAMVRKHSGLVQTGVEGMPRPLDKDVERRTEGKDKTKEKAKEKEGDDKRRDKRKDKDREKKGQGKDKDRDKEKKKEEKAKMKSEHKNSEKDKLKDSNKDDLMDIDYMKTLHLPKDSDKSTITEGNLKKRKDLETNGFFHANDIKPNKLQRLASSSHPLIETNKLPAATSSSYPLMGNGKILESCQTSTLFTSDRQGAANNLKADIKEHKVNGIIVSQPLSVTKAKPLVATAQADRIAEVSTKPSIVSQPLSVTKTKPLVTTAQSDRIAEVSTKPPHPDSKYLSQILSVPKMEEWSDFDDQEWLFHSQSKNPKVGTSGDDETAQVWAEAMQIDSADVCALPYVIPY